MHTADVLSFPTDMCSERGHPVLNNKRVHIYSQELKCQPQMKHFLNSTIKANMEYWRSTVKIICTLVWDKQYLLKMYTLLFPNFSNVINNKIVTKVSL